MERQEGIAKSWSYVKDIICHCHKGDFLTKPKAHEDLSICN